MRRLLATALLLSSVSTFAGGFDYTKEDMEDYNGSTASAPVKPEPFARDGKAIYIFGNYMFTHRLWSSSTQTATAGSVTVSYEPSNVFPNNFNGFNFGIGKELSRYIDFQLSYIQYLKKTKSASYQTQSYSTSVEMQGALADVAFIMNPDDQVQTFFDVGGVVESVSTSISVDGTTYYPTNDQTQVEPAAGFGLLWLFTPSFGMNFNLLYVANVENSQTHGDALGFMGLTYIF